MATALLDLHYLPNILWLRNYLKYDAILIERQENFVKATGRNRCEIAGANGRQTLTIPLLGGRDHHRRYADTEIAYQTSWQDSHWHSIKSAYGSAPYFEFYAHIFQKFYEKQYSLLFDFNLALLHAVLAALKVKKGFEFTTDFEKSPIDKIDLRTDRSADVGGWRGRQPQGQMESFSRYYQVFEERNGFMPNLSVLDLIFNLGPESGGYLRGMNTE